MSASTVLIVDDQTGLLYGWNVTLQASTFVWTSPGETVDANRNLSAANLSVTQATAVTTVAGAEFVGAFGGGTLDSAVSVVSTAPGAGSGSYTVPLTVNLAVPANTPAGSYVGTLTTTISAAP